MNSLRTNRSMSPERNEDVVQPGTLIDMSERVTFILKASNTAGVIVLGSVTSPCNTELITEDAKEANE